MALDHERLDVYLIALDFVVFANEVSVPVPDLVSQPRPELGRT